jgi:hypothetical protein
LKLDSNAGEGEWKSYPVFSQHICVPFSQVFTPLVVVYTLNLLAFGEVIPNNASFHGFYPRFADVLLASFQFLYVAVKMCQSRKEGVSKKENVQLCGESGPPSMRAALVSLTDMVDSKRSEAGVGALRRDRRNIPKGKQDSAGYFFGFWVVICVQSYLPTSSAHQ